MDNSNNYLASFPKEKGNYLLLFQLEKDISVLVGALGLQFFPQGRYAYMGSALGPGGIRARLRHHLNPSPKPHWHMDYLKPNLQWVAVGWQVTENRLECEWAQTLTASNGAKIPVVHFGSSDCTQKCQAHLVLMPASAASPFDLLAIKGQIDFKYNKTNL